MLTKHDFLYLLLHLLQWNESKLSMFIKICTIRRKFLVFLKKWFEEVFTLSKLLALRFFTNRWSYLLIYITFGSRNYIPMFGITWFIFTKSLRNINYKMKSQYLHQLLKFIKKKMRIQGLWKCNPLSLIRTLGQLK